MSSVLFSEDSQNLLQGDAEPHSADVQDQVKPQNEEPASETQTPNQNDENIEDEEFSERETDPLESPHKNVVVVRFSVKYIVTVDGFLKMAQVVSQNSLSTFISQCGALTAYDLLSIG